MKKILVLVEEIDDHEYLINNALKMANSWGAKLLIGHVRPPKVLVMGRAYVAQNVRQKHQFLLEKENVANWLVLLKKYNLNKEVITIDGNSIQSLLSVIDEYQVDFVLTQSGTRSWINEKMFGSCWSTLFADCKIPVLVYPKLEKLEERKTKGFSETDSLSFKAIES